VKNDEKLENFLGNAPKKTLETQHRRIETSTSHIMSYHHDVLIALRDLLDLLHYRSSPTVNCDSFFDYSNFHFEPIRLLSACSNQLSYQGIGLASFFN
jgi:hypothetical protein